MLLKEARPKGRFIAKALAQAWQGKAKKNTALF